MFPCLPDTVSHSLHTFLRKQWRFTKLGISVIFLSVTTVSMPFVTMLFAGQLGKVYLDGVGLSNTIYNIVVTSVWFGYATVFDTYAPQVYGSSKKHELGTILLKCLLQGALIYFFALGPYLNLVYLIGILPLDDKPTVNTTVAAIATGHVNLLDGFNASSYAVYNDSSGAIFEGSAEDDFRIIAVEYLRTTCLNGYLDYVTFMVSKYFAIQQGEKYVYAVSAVMVAAQVLSNYILVMVCDMGLQGIVLAALIGRIVPLVLSICICIVNVRRGHFIWSVGNSRVFAGWWPMIKLGISGTLNVFAELFLLEIATFMSQFDGEEALSVVLVSFQLASVLWAVTNGICCGATTLIGKALGEGNKAEIKSYIGISIGNALGFATTLSVISFCVKENLIRIFSEDRDVLTLFNQKFWLVCLWIPLDHTQAVLNRGILTAFGEQKFIAVSMGVISAFIGLPIIAVSIFLSDIGISGIYIGFIVFSIANIVVPAVRVRLYNFEEEIEKSKIRVAQSTSKNSLKRERLNSRSLPRGGIVNPVYTEKGGLDLGVSSAETPDPTEKRKQLQEVRSDLGSGVPSLVDDEIGFNQAELVAQNKKNYIFKENANVIWSFLVCAIWFISLGAISLIKH